MRIDLHHPAEAQRLVGFAAMKRDPGDPAVEAVFAEGKRRMASMSAGSRRPGTVRAGEIVVDVFQVRWVPQVCFPRGTIREGSRRVHLWICLVRTGAMAARRSADFHGRERGDATVVANPGPGSPPASRCSCITETPCAVCMNSPRADAAPSRSCDLPASCRCRDALPHQLCR